MVYTDTWDAAFEADPGDGDNFSEGAERIRDFKTAVQERLEHDHYFDIAGTDADHGEHLLITFHAQSAPGSPGANKAYLYTKDVSAKAELHYKDEDDNEIQLTSAGEINGIPSTEIILFEKDTAVAGYTLLTTKNDYIVYIGSGSGAAGLPGAADRSGGTWTQPNHVHQWYKAETGADDSYDSAGSEKAIAGGADTGAGISVIPSGSASNYLAHNCYTNPQATANTWRPQGYVFTRQQKV